MFFLDYIKCIKLIYSLYKLFYKESEKNIEIVKYCAENCGPIGQKLLQYLVMQDGFLSSEAKNKLEYIFEDCIAHSWEDTKSIYLADYSKNIEDDFKINEVDKIPIGSGTIGQVYKLYHRELDMYIALKVRHLNVDIEAGKFILTVSNILKVINILAFFVPFTVLIKEFLNNVNIQLDYKLEANNTERLRKNFINDDHIIIPQVFFSSSKIIGMSYHEGIPITKIDDKHKILKTKITHDMLLFNLSSLLIYDLLHCDLHYGNWKVQIDWKEVPEYRLIIYDCGIVGSTYNDDINKKIYMACMDGDYNKIYEIMAPDMDTQKNGLLMKKYTEELMNKYYKNRTDKFADFLKQMFMYNIKINTVYLRCIQGLLTCLSLLVHTSEKVTKTLGKDGSRVEVFICYYSGVLKKIKKYPALLNYFNIWMQTDSNIEKVFYEWLEKYFGHQDKEVFIDAILHHLITT
jgi:predicted unusual protein kinase regulating ubiquinone biosynthesis (AarF/ABC1/UbiB family)